MNIDAIGQNKLKISLTDDEVIAVFGGYEYLNYDNKSQEKLNCFLNNIIKENKFTLDSQRLLIEVKEERSGCSITLTKIHKTDSKKYRLTPFFGKTAIFNSSEQMLKNIFNLYNSSLKIRKTDLYYIDGKYYLIIYSRYSNMQLLEYCSNISSDKTLSSYAEEYGTPLCIGNAVEKLGNIFN